MTDFRTQPLLITSTSMNRNVAIRCWVSLCVLLSAGTGLKATTFVIYRSSSAIVFGIDSVSINVDERGVRREEQTCKLAALENAVFVATGLISVGGVGAWPVFFEAQAVALKNWSRDGSIDERFRTLEAAMFAAIQDAALHISPDVVTRDDMNLTITVGGFERGIPVLLGRQFVLTRDGGVWRLQMGRRFRCGADCEVEHAYMVSGHQRTIMASPEWQNRRELVGEIGVVGAVRRLIELEFGHPDVGPPVDLIRITNNGIEKLEGKPNCPPLQ